MPPSTTPSFFEDAGYRAEEAFAVEGEADVSDIFAVVGGFYGYREFVAAVYLRPAGESGEDVVGSVFIAFGYEVVLVPERGAGADDRHFARGYTPDLRQFIQREFTEPSAVFRIHLSGSFSICVGIFAGVSVYIVRNFGIMKVVLCIPTRFCQKSTGPFESNFTITAITAIGTARTSRPQHDSMRSISLLI